MACNHLFDYILPLIIVKQLQKLVKYISKVPNVTCIIIVKHIRLQLTIQGLPTASPAFTGLLSILAVKVVFICLTHIGVIPHLFGQFHKRLRRHIFHAIQALIVVKNFKNRGLFRVSIGFSQIESIGVNVDQMVSFGVKFIYSESWIMVRVSGERRPYTQNSSWIFQIGNRGDHVELIIVGMAEHLSYDDILEPVY